MTNIETKEYIVGLSLHRKKKELTALFLEPLTESISFVLKSDNISTEKQLIKEIRRVVNDLGQGKHYTILLGRSDKQFRSALLREGYRVRLTRYTTKQLSTKTTQYKKIAARNGIEDTIKHIEEDKVSSELLASTLLYLDSAKKKEERESRETTNQYQELLKGVIGELKDDDVVLMITDKMKEGLTNGYKLEHTIWSIYDEMDKRYKESYELDQKTKSSMYLAVDAIKKLIRNSYFEGSEENLAITAPLYTSIPYIMILWNDVMDHRFIENHVGPMTAYKL